MSAVGLLCMRPRDSCIRWSAEQAFGSACPRRSVRPVLSTCNFRGEQTLTLRSTSSIGARLQKFEYHTNNNYEQINQKARRP
eukprot:3263788-Amphidinium_carterae.1